MARLGLVGAGTCRVAARFARAGLTMIRPIFCTTRMSVYNTPHVNNLTNEVHVMKFLHNVSLLILMLLSSITVFAQEDKHSDPTDPSALVPTVKDESAFSDYRSFQEQKVAPWKQVIDEVMGIPDVAGHAGHDGISEEVAPSAEVAAANPQAPTAAPEGSTDAPATTEIAATGVILQIDKVNAKVKIAHDPIQSLGWPKMTMLFRLKNASIADQVREKEKVEFFLEKSSTGYVISRFGKTISGPGK